MAATEQDFTPADANPVYSFRAPKKLPEKHAAVHGEHFITDQKDVINDRSSVAAIYPGYFRLRSNPTQELDFKLWEDREDTHSLRDWARMTGEGFTEALAKDFDINFRVRHLWRPDTGKRITLGGHTKPALVLMYRTGEEAQRKQEEKLRLSTDVQTSVEQKAAGAAKNWQREAGNLDLPADMEVTDVKITEGEEETIQLKEE